MALKKNKIKITEKGRGVVISVEKIVGISDILFDNVLVEISEIEALKV